MLIHYELSFNLWDKAFLSACHIINRIPLKKTSIFPYEVWKVRASNISYFRVWGVSLIIRAWNLKGLSWILERSDVLL